MKRNKIVRTIELSIIMTLVVVCSVAAQMRRMTKQDSLNKARWETKWRTAKEFAIPFKEDSFNGFQIFHFDECIFFGYSGGFGEAVYIVTPRATPKLFKATFTCAIVPTVTNDYSSALALYPLSINDITGFCMTPVGPEEFLWFQQKVKMIYKNFRVQTSANGDFISPISLVRSNGNICMYIIFSVDPTGVNSFANLNKIRVGYNHKEDNSFKIASIMVPVR